MSERASTISWLLIVAFFVPIWCPVYVVLIAPRLFAALPFDVAATVAGLILLAPLLLAFIIMSIAYLRSLGGNQ